MATCQQVEDLREEGRELYEFMASAGRIDWRQKTQFKGWTINDVVLHLYAGDLTAAASAQGPEAFAEFRRASDGLRRSGLSSAERSRILFKGLGEEDLLQCWWTNLQALCTTLAAKSPVERFIWVGPDMGLKMFTTARQMETWAHSQAIYDIWGCERRPTRRLRNIAHIGVKTFGWTFTNRGLPVPENPPFVRLTAPAGDVWEWNSPAHQERVAGNANEFCQVVAQTRNVADTGLTISGATAASWMSMAQCFAGPPHDPPAKGTRFKVPSERDRI